MNVAITVWNKRISPVFDVARRIVVIEIEDGNIINRKTDVFSSDQPMHKAAKLVELCIHTLICGAISKSHAGIISTYGIHTIPFIAGDIEEVILAHLAGKLPNPVLQMPGCCKHYKRYKNKHCKQYKNIVSNHH